MHHIFILKKKDMNDDEIPMLHYYCKYVMAPSIKFNALTRNEHSLQILLPTTSDESVYCQTYKPNYELVYYDENEKQQDKTKS